MGKKVGVLLSGRGVYDGAEFHEAGLTYYTCLYPGSRR